MAIIKEKNAMLGNRIADTRKASGVTQAQLARDIGVLPTHLNKWEKGKVAPGWDYLVLIAKHCNISLDKLLTGEEQEKALRHKDISIPSLTASEPTSTGGMSEQNLKGTKDSKFGVQIKKLDAIYKEGNLTQRGLTRGIIDEVYDEIVDQKEVELELPEKKRMAG